MKEREYSFKVTNVNTIINYLTNHDFKLVLDCAQTRTIFKNTNNIMARITENKFSSGKEEIILDFKEDKLTDEILVERKESLPLVVDGLEIALSTIDILGYKQSIILQRQRKTFVKNNVICEIDLYTSPNRENVISIEGENYKSVDELYLILKGLKNE